MHNGELLGLLISLFPLTKDASIFMCFWFLFIFGEKPVQIIIFFFFFWDRSSNYWSISFCSKGLPWIPNLSSPTSQMLDHRHVPPCLIYVVLRIKTRALCWTDILLIELYLCPCGHFLLHFKSSFITDTDPLPDTLCKDVSSILWGVFSVFL